MVAKKTDTIDARSVRMANTKYDYTFGAIEKIDLKDIRIATTRSPIKMLSLMPGEAFTIKGIERGYLGSYATAMKKSDKRQFTIRRIGEFEYKVIRLK